jgi:hypothetical protein
MPFAWISWLTKSVTFFPEGFNTAHFTLQLRVDAGFVIIGWLIIGFDIMGFVIMGFIPDIIGPDPGGIIGPDMGTPIGPDMGGCMKEPPPPCICIWLPAM